MPTLRHTCRYLPAIARPANLAGNHQRERRGEGAQELAELGGREAEAEGGIVGERDQRDVEQDLVGPVAIGQLGDERRCAALGFGGVGLDMAQHDRNRGEQDQYRAIRIAA